MWPVILNRETGKMAFDTLTVLAGLALYLYHQLEIIK
jgi:hypothetical protein